MEPFSYQGYTIRPASGTEANALAPFFRTAGGETDFLSFSAEDCPYTEEVSEGFLKECMRDENLLLLAYKGEALIGEISLTAPNRKRFLHTRELGIALLKAHCDKGLGTALMQAALLWADSEGIDSISLTVSCENTRALHLYEKLGFRVFGVYPRQSFYNGAYHDTAYMVRFRVEKTDY